MGVLPDHGRGRAARSIRGSLAAWVKVPPVARLIPAVMAPPRYSPSRVTALKVVAVPGSRSTQAGPPYESHDRHCIGDAVAPTWDPLTADLDAGAQSPSTTNGSSSEVFAAGLDPTPGVGHNEEARQIPSALGSLSVYPHFAEGPGTTDHIRPACGAWSVANLGVRTKDITVIQTEVTFVLPMSIVRSMSMNHSE